MSEPPEQLLRRWIHVHEEDTADEIVYRPAGHPLPPARGRAGLDFRPGGDFVDELIGPADAPQGVAGHWELEEPGRVKVCFDETSRPERTIEIVHVDDEVLKVRRQPRKEAT